MPTLSHACVRVLDLARSVAFYRETLGLTPQRELTMEDRGWHLVFLGDGVRRAGGLRSILRGGPGGGGAGC